jgi:hypothetical protein
MKLKDRKQLNNILGHMRKANDFLMKESTIIAVKSNATCMPEDTFINKKTGETCHIFTKQIGNDLCYLFNAINLLESFINQPNN